MNKEESDKIFLEKLYQDLARDKNFLDQQLYQSQQTVVPLAKANIEKFAQMQKENAQFQFLQIQEFLGRTVR